MKLKTSCNVEQAFTLEVFFETRTAEIEVTVGFDWENNGIGSYEYWGSKGFDKGITYLVANEILWDSTGFSLEEVELVEGEIEASMTRWTEKAEKDAESYGGD